MKNYLYKILLALVLLSQNIISFAYDFKVNGLCYNIISVTNNTVEVTWESIGICYVGDIVVPNTVSYKSKNYDVVGIGKHAFVDVGAVDSQGKCVSWGNNSDLKSITLSTNILYIGDNAFSGCNGIKNIIFPSKLNSIGAGSLEGTSLQEVIIPKAVSNIENNSFFACYELSSISVESGNMIYDSRNKCNAIIETSSNTLIVGCKRSVIPSSVIKIGDYAFAACRGLTSMTIPSSVTSIGFKSFAYCDNLNFVDMPNSIISIGADAFEQCEKLTSILIPPSVVTIDRSAFWGCSGLASIIIPSSVKNIRERAFFGCKNLALVISQIDTPFSINENVFDDISSNAVLQIPQGTKSLYQQYSGWTKNFKEVIEEGQGTTTTYTLSITSTGQGYVTYSGTTIRSKTTSFTVNEGISADVTFSPDNGYRIKNVKVNNNDVTSRILNNSYTISNISRNTTLEVEFEAIPTVTYTLSVKSTGNGSASYNGTFVRNTTRSFTVTEGSSVSISLMPDNGYRIKSVKENGTNVISYISSNKYVISSITRNTTVEVEFEAIPPTMRRTLTITASGNGDVQYGSTTVRNQTSAVEVEEGSSAIVTFVPDGGNRIATVKVNGQDVTASIENYRYNIANISGDIMIVAAFEEIISEVAYDGVNYSVVSQDEGTVKVAAGNYGQVLTVPASFTAIDRTWQVTGIEADALKDNVGLAAVIWDPEVAFTATVSNPNLLLYVKSEAYAPQAIHNVVVNGTAANITLVEAVDGNDFYCPQTFTAQKISYSHSYGMQTGIRESRGWETIALPFDVQIVTHSTKGSIVPFVNWKNSDTSKPFWLYELTGTGFVEAGSIKAYTPYIISMPNNPQYDSQWLLSGVVTFAASNVTVGMTDNVQTSQYQERTFVPNFQTQEANQGLYALNVVNDYCANNSGMTEGSKFVLNMRRIHPFEAYMTTASNTRYAIGVFEDMTTGIRVMVDGSWMMVEAVYDLQGRKVESPSTKGVYIMNGKKKIIK